MALKKGAEILAKTGASLLWNENKIYNTEYNQKKSLFQNG
jgi:hypothetical protein